MHKAKTGLKSRENRKKWGRIQEARKKQHSGKTEKELGAEQIVSLFFTGILLLLLFQMLLKVNWKMMCVILVFLLLRIPTHVKYHKQRVWQKRRVEEVSLYMDTLLYAFLKEGKIEAALSDVFNNLEEGQMRQTIQKALNSMHMSYHQNEVFQDALCVIEEQYPCKRIRNIHRFMLRVEEYGGDITSNMELLILDKQMWETRVVCSIKEREKGFRDVILSIVASLLICALIQQLPVKNIDLSTNQFVQFATVIVFILDDFILARAQKMLGYDWVNPDDENSDDYYEEKMREWSTYDARKKRGFSWIMGTIAVVIAGVFFILKKTWIGIIIAFLSLFLFNQHRIGHYLQERKLEKEIKRVFPSWLMEIVLLLQSENVHMALFHSKETVPGIMKRELHALIARIQMDPENPNSYLQFLKPFQIQEIHAAMSMLYAISMGHGGDGDKQLCSLIERNLKMQDVAEEQRNKDLNAGMYLLFLAPVLTGSFKILIDMLFFMFQFLSAVSI